MSYTLVINFHDNSRLDRSSSIFSHGLCALTHRWALLLAPLLPSCRCRGRRALSTSLAAVQPVPFGIHTRPGAITLKFIYL